MVMVRSTLTIEVLNIMYLKISKFWEQKLYKKLFSIFLKKENNLTLIT